MIQSDATSLSTNAATSSFTMEANASMFTMLTKNVYNNVIAASIREWSTNAVDACIDADLPIRFDAHLPTIAEPTFSVRDYGTGLSLEDIHGLFTVLGASTKRHSNKFNGAFGVGRLSGLAYSESFTVESFYNGTKHTILISMKEGIPSSVDLGDQPTEEPNGLRLSLSVIPSDIESFRSNAVNIYRYFADDQKPNLNIDLDISSPIASVSGSDWFISDSLRGNYVLMANVMYRIPDEVDTKGFSSLVLNVPTGKVAINPGRESLTVDKTTQAYLESFIDRVKDDYIESAEEAISEADTPAEELQMLYSFHSAAPYPLNSKLSQSSIVSPEAEVHVRNATTFLPSNDYVIKRKTSYYKSLRDVTEDRIHTNTFFNAPTIVLIDKKTKYTHIKDLVESDSIFISKPKDTDFDSWITAAKQYWTNFGLEYTLASSFPEPESSSATKRMTDELHAYTSVYPSNVYNYTQINPSTSYYYIDTLSTSTSSADDQLIIAYQYLLADIPSRKPLIGVPKKSKKIVEASSNFTRLTPAIVKSLMAHLQFSSEAYNYDQRNLYRLTERYEQLFTDHNIIPPDTSTVITLSSNSHIQAAKDLGANMSTAVSDYVSSTLAKYPLLFHCSQSSSDLARYLTLEDSYASLCSDD